MCKPKLTRNPFLRFTPNVWAKVLFMRDIGKTEIAGYGISATEDPLLITDFIMVKQKCTEATFEFDEDDSAKFQEEMVDNGLEPWQFSRILIHTHPGSCPNPSGKDEENFNKYFSNCHWAIFYILAKGGEEYCRLRYNVGPGIEVLLKTKIDYQVGFPGTDTKEWKKEYEKHVEEDSSLIIYTGSNKKLWYDENIDRWSSFDDEEIWSQMNDEDEIYVEKDGKVTYWDEDTEEYYTYDPKIDKFFFVDDMDNGKLRKFQPKKEPTWMNRIRSFARGEENVVTR